MRLANSQATVAACARADRRPARAVSQLIRGLEAARGNGTSMISLIMHPRDQVSGAAARRHGVSVQHTRQGARLAPVHKRL
jgi:hypothetical protein